MRAWKNWQGQNKRTPSQDADIERGVFAALILMVVVMLAIVIGTVAEMLSPISPL